jgi:hypothetical protein
MVVRHEEWEPTSSSCRVSRLIAFSHNEFQVCLENRETPAHYGAPLRIGLGNEAIHETNHRATNLRRIVNPEVSGGPGAAEDENLHPP